MGCELHTALHNFMGLFILPCAGKAGMLQLPCMLVCPFVCANRTRDRGCSKHPVFPAPSNFRGGQTKMQTSGSSCREIANTYSVVITRAGGCPVFQRRQ